MNVNNTAKGFIPEIYTASIYRTLEDNLILNKIFKAPVKGEGDTFHFTDLEDPTISTYTGTLTSESLKDSNIKMEIDNTKTFCFDVSDLDRLMANVDLKHSQSQRSAYSLKNAVERHVLTDIGTDANAGTALSATITSANVLSQMSELARMLEENNVDQSNMWLAIPPWLRLKLQIAGVSFSINEGVNGKGGMFWTKDLGFDVYVSNTIYNSGSQATPVSTVLAGSYQACGYKDKMLNTRTNESLTSRKIQIDGGVAYGFKTVKPKELAKGVFTFGAETTI